MNKNRNGYMFSSATSERRHTDGHQTMSCSSRTGEGAAHRPEAQLHPHREGAREGALQGPTAEEPTVETDCKQGLAKKKRILPHPP